jgi:hypothetical protein
VSAAYAIRAEDVVEVDDSDGSLVFFRRVRVRRERVS